MKKEISVNLAMVNSFHVMEELVLSQLIPLIVLALGVLYLTQELVQDHWEE